MAPGRTAFSLFGNHLIAGSRGPRTAPQCGSTRVDRIGASDCPLAAVRLVVYALSVRVAAVAVAALEASRDGAHVVRALR